MLRAANSASVAAYEASLTSEKMRDSHQSDAATARPLVFGKGRGRGIQPTAEQQETVQLKSVPLAAADSPPADAQDGVVATAQGLPWS